jgi:glycosyltransferase involved in cell wall biosynthesis
MVARAIASFRAQTYSNKWLLVYDSGETPVVPECFCFGSREAVCRQQKWKRHTIGALRNAANSLASHCDIIAHWDSDDWSHPRRLEEQVALLQATGKACVGYREVLFWDTRHGKNNSTGWKKIIDLPRNEAWLYSHGDQRYVLGTSMCYWRSAWESCPFDDAIHEDRRWWLKNAEKCLGNPSIGDAHPRMVCGIHGTNTEAYDRSVMLRSAPEWRPAPEWNSYCAMAMGAVPTLAAEETERELREIVL